MSKNSPYAVCGLYCGLCPRFHSRAMSRCPGCSTGTYSTYCGIYRCCVKKRGLTSCAGCGDYPCQRQTRVTGVTGDGQCLFDGGFITNRACYTNIISIREAGLDRWLEEQRERQSLLEEMLDDYNGGTVGHSVLHRRRPYACGAAERGR